MTELTKAVECCPHCGSMNIAKAGSKDGRKRFKCKESQCRKSFNALTGTPLARLRMSDKHIDHAKCMVKKLTIRKTVAKLGINIHTAFLWRHRFLESIRKAQPEKLSGSWRLMKRSSSNHSKDNEAGCLVPQKNGELRDARLASAPRAVAPILHSHEVKPVHTHGLTAGLFTAS